MKKLFINPTDQRLRAGWRILLTIILFLSLNILLSVGIRTILGGLKAEGTLWWAILGFSATVAAFISRKYFDKKNLPSLGLNFDKHAIIDLFSGVINSAIVMALTYLIMLHFDLIEFVGFSWWTDDAHSTSFSLSVLPTALAVLWSFMIVAWWEELFFRGIILQNIKEGLNMKWAIILSTMAFGLVHAGNPNATVLSTVIIMIITLQLVYAYLKTKQLWLPIGLHLGWNFFQASVFGYASSGHESPTLITQNPIGPDWLSGGAFGAEGSIILIPLLLGSLVLINLSVRWTRKSGDVVQILLKDFQPNYS